MIGKGDFGDFVGGAGQFEGVDIVVVEIVVGYEIVVAVGMVGLPRGRGAVAACAVEYVTRRG